MPRETKILNDAAHECFDSLEAAIEVFSDSEPAEPEPTTITKEGVTTTPQPESDPLQDAIWNLNEREMVLEAEIEELQKRVKGKKSELETTADEKRRLIRATRESLPLFDRKPEPEPFEAGDDDWTNTPVKDLEKYGLREKDIAILRERNVKTLRDLERIVEWESCPIGELVKVGMPKKYVDLLAEGGVETIEGIKRLGDQGLGVADVKGIGPTAADKIDAVLDLFWKTRDALLEAESEHAYLAAVDDEAEQAAEPDDSDYDQGYRTEADDAIDYPDDETEEVADVD